jgi:tetratricopeptide (TPR) repeat protein
MAGFLASVLMKSFSESGSAQSSPLISIERKVAIFKATVKRYVSAGGPGAARDSHRRSARITTKLNGLYRRALELDPGHAHHMGNFAEFMEKVRKNYDEAERLYRKALGLDPEKEIIRKKLRNSKKQQDIH